MRASVIGASIRRVDPLSARLCFGIGGNLLLCRLWLTNDIDDDLAVATDLDLRDL
ncbi:hypothetical protein HU675_0016225 [Bradyrhizobium septentrionale]|uniref:hypothetical protein n=1 Tax=Bradyrhizobium septentrionale TaxID=1404411 RepID=UPI001596EC4A|nr:hypothetical protein [Bradyrhizobium septentrionale]UGY28176.1 hypothetical protein HU675_0016225 [Bradyrhizobium septentrionale]